MAPAPCWLFCPSWGSPVGSFRLAGAGMAESCAHSVLQPFVLGIIRSRPYKLGIFDLQKFKNCCCHICHSTASPWTCAQLAIACTWHAAICMVSWEKVSVMHVACSSFMRMHGTSGTCMASHLVSVRRYRRDCQGTCDGTRAINSQRRMGKSVHTHQQSHVEQHAVCSVDHWCPASQDKHCQHLTPSQPARR